MDWTLQIKEISAHAVAVPLVSPFETSFGKESLRAAVLVRVVTANGAEGWGEVTASWTPGYSYETAGIALHVLEEFLIPRLLRVEALHSDEHWGWLEGVRGYPLSKHGLLSAIFTAVAAEHNIPLAELLRRLAGADRYNAAVKVGVSIGIQPSIDATLAAIKKHLEEGYGRIKLKIKPGWDIDMLREVCKAFPDILLMVDANSAYTLEDSPLLRQLDELNLLMIEQPLGYEDIYEHSLLQPQLKTPLCLDESLHSLGHVQVAQALAACRIVNLKPQRVGGLLEAIKIHNFCGKHGLGLWVGGMLETGVGRAVSLALASLPNMTLPADLSATARYYDPDLADPPFVLNAADSTITVPTGVGLGVTVNYERLAEAEAVYKAASH